MNVNLPMNRATVKFDDAVCTAQQLQQSVERMGFELIIDQTDDEGTNIFADEEITSEKNSANLPKNLELIIILRYTKNTELRIEVF